jgi:ribosomal-protein-alanine N-acetyltransferase
MSTWAIRHATLRDVDDILIIEESQFPEPWSRGMLVDELSVAENRRFTVVEIDRDVVGFLGLMYVHDNVMHINTLGVRPGFERRGIATALLTDGFADARTRGIERATLEVATSNTGAHQLYFRFGFKPVGVRTRYYEKTGEDALILWAELAEPADS